MSIDYVLYQALCYTTATPTPNCPAPRPVELTKHAIMPPPRKPATRKKATSIAGENTVPRCLAGVRQRLWEPEQSQQG